jgi:murein DD-endopeptidase MepM/ murein hydrolase activator NlpD
MTPTTAPRPRPAAPSVSRRLPLLVPALALLLSACTGVVDPIARGPRPERRPPRERTPAPSSTPAPRTGSILATRDALVIPVRGIRPEQLRDSYNDARGGGSRSHHAIDIMAPRGTPVQAAADGRILKLRTGGLGGITIYQVAEDGRTLLYYAHLQGYAAGLREGDPVRRGQIIAYVGDTGNAGRGNYHLHFSLGTLRDPARWWESENVNPYPLLAGEFARNPRRGEAMGGGQE